MQIKMAPTKQDNYNRNQKYQKLVEAYDEKNMRSWLTTEVRFFIWLVVGIATAVWGIAVPYFGIKNEIALIKENDMTHIEAFEKEQTRLSEVQTKQQEEIIALMTAVAKISK